MIRWRTLSAGLPQPPILRSVALNCPAYRGQVYPGVDVMILDLWICHLKIVPNTLTFRLEVQEESIFPLPEYLKIQMKLALSIFLMPNQSPLSFDFVLSLQNFDLNSCPQSCKKPPPPGPFSSLPDFLVVGSESRRGTWPRRQS